MADMERTDGAAGMAAEGTPVTLTSRGAARAEVGAAEKDGLFGMLAVLARMGVARVFNARGEFACNSSSSHSIIILPRGKTIDRNESLLGDGEYGWDEFTLTDSASKLRYLAAMLAGRATYAPVAAAIRENLEEWSTSDYVDHQSVMSFPTDRFQATSVEFILDIARLMAQPEVAVLGGNDNDEGHPLAGMEGATRLPFFDGRWVARKDEGADGEAWWCLFNKGDGTKLRLCLDVEVLREFGNDFIPKKAATPELVDIKLTDACAYERDCGFCYMGSTIKGKPADPASVMATLAALSELGVFEVALGGGEPTLWPGFEETLRFARSVGVVPNFTSKNYGVFRRHPSWLSLVGSVAFSVNDEGALAKVSKEVTPLDYTERKKISIQCIPEILSTETLKKILAEAANLGIRVTLLGYKETGRGSDFEGRVQRDPGFWIPLASAHDRLRLAIDTVLAEACEDALLAAGVPGWSFSTNEGAFSMYIDAVEGRCGPSSYVDPGTMDVLDLSVQPGELATTINAHFAQY